MSANKYYIAILMFLLLLAMQNSFAIVPQQQKTIKTFDQNFKERYKGSKFEYEGKAIVTETPSGSGNYEDFKNKKTKDQEINNNDQFYINLGPLGWVFYIAIFAAVVYLAYILLNEGSSGLFSSKQNKKIDSYTEITSENIENSDINSLINHAEKENNYRLAIRYYYLLVLKTLSLKNHIKILEDKTNADYLNETRTKPFSNDFKYISYLYDYTWYGEFPLNSDEYLSAKRNFITLLNQVK